MENFYDIDHPVLGILGGLGPAASCYFYQMVTEHTGCARSGPYRSGFEQPRHHA